MLERGSAPLTVLDVRRTHALRHLWYSPGLCMKESWLWAHGLLLRLTHQGLILSPTRSYLGAFA